MTQLLMALAVLAGYGVFVFVKPARACRRCSGWGARGRRRSACGRCRGTGKTFRPGARLVHRGAALAMRYVREWREGG